MSHRFLLSWLLLLSFWNFPARAATAEQSPRFLVHLLDYLAKDYGGAVSEGRVLNAEEYQEQVEFSEAASKATREIPALASDGELRTRTEELNQLILSKADAAKVSKLARALQARVIQTAHIEVAPTQWPSLKRGQQIYQQNCVACHGATGAGNGPAAANMVPPKPANFLEEGRMRQLSPFQAFNTVRLGIPGTSMQALDQLSDQQAWDVSFYVLSLRHAGAASQAEIQNLLSQDTKLLERISSSSDEKLEASFSDKSENDRKAWVAALRTHSSGGGDDHDQGGGSAAEQVGSLRIAREELDEALLEYQAGQPKSAQAKALKAYFEGIEPAEPRLKATAPAVVYELEKQMSEVRKAIEQGAPLAELQRKIESAKAKITEAEKLMTRQGMSPWIAFIAAAAILLREGFEAVLIVIALLGVTRAAGAKRAALWVHGGWLSALGLGAIAWFFSGWLLGMSGAQRETLEGITSLFAVAVLLIVGFWLHSQTEAGRWKAFIQGKVQKALAGKNLWTLASISFVAVFREAFETILFFRALWLEAGNDAKLAMGAGVAGSLVLVIAMAWAILKYSAKLPIRKLFGGSAAIMAVLALILTGKGLHNFQETGLLGVTNSPFSFHLDLLGFYPTWETLLAQLLVILMVGALWLYGKRPSAKPAR